MLSHQDIDHQLFLLIVIHILDQIMIKSRSKSKGITLRRVFHKKAYLFGRANFDISKPISSSIAILHQNKKVAMVVELLQVGGEQLVLSHPRVSR